MEENNEIIAEEFDSNIDYDSVEIRDDFDVAAGVGEDLGIDIVETDEKWEDISESNITINSLDFKNALSVVSAVIIDASTDVLNKTVMIQVVGDECVFRAVSHSTHVEYRVPVVNKDNVYTDPIFVQYSYVVKVCTVLSKHIAFIVKDNGVFVRLLGGDLILETVGNLDSDLFVMKGEVKKEIMDCEANELFSVFKAMSPFLSNEVNVKAQKVCIKDGFARYVSKFLCYEIEAMKSKEPLMFKLLDVAIFKKLLTVCRGHLKFNRVEAKVANQMLVTFDNCKLSFIMDSSTFDDKVLVESEKNVSDKAFQIEFSKLYKWVNLAMVLPFSQQTIVFGSDGPGELTFGLQTKLGKNDIKFDSLNPEAVLEDEFTTVSSQLIVLLSGFAGFSYVDLYFADNKLSISADGRFGKILLSV